MAYMTRRNTNYWALTFWILLPCWVIGAILFTYKIKAGILNSYLADATFPPWFYIQLRGLHRKDGRLLSGPVNGKWFGLSPWRAGISIFLVGVISEFFFLVWPKQLSSGTFDPNDIIAYAAGLIICMVIDLRQCSNLNSN
jgi:hypothetical protein